MSEFIDIFSQWSFWSAVLRIATPLILGTLGVLLCERAGVLNLGIEGIMVAGAFSGWLAVYSGMGLWAGVVVAALLGRRRDVEQDQLVGALILVERGQLLGVAGIAQVLETDTLDHAAVAHLDHEARLTGSPHVRRDAPLPGRSGVSSGATWQDG